MYTSVKRIKMEAAMIYRSYSLLLTVISIFLFIGAVASTDVMSSQDREERPNKSRSSDYIVTGQMNDYSENYIVVDNRRHRLCKDVMVFTPRDTLIPLKDIDAAEEVKLFENNGCVRKIKVLRFAE